MPMMGMSAPPGRGPPARGMPAPPGLPPMDGMGMPPPPGRGGPPAGSDRKVTRGAVESEEEEEMAVEESKCLEVEEAKGDT